MEDMEEVTMKTDNQKNRVIYEPVYNEKTGRLVKLKLKYTPSPKLKLTLYSRPGCKYIEI